eukprot:3747307-Prymnesium_polylepis.1
MSRPKRMVRSSAAMVSWGVSRKKRARAMHFCADAKPMAVRDIAYGRHGAVIKDLPSRLDRYWHPRLAVVAHAEYIRAIARTADSGLDLHLPAHQTHLPAGVDLKPAALLIRRRLERRPPCRLVEHR